MVQASNSAIEAVPPSIQKQALVHIKGLTKRYSPTKRGCCCLCRRQAKGREAEGVLAVDNLNLTLNVGQVRPPCTQAWHDTHLALAQHLSLACFRLPTWRKGSS